MPLRPGWAKPSHSRSSGAHHRPPGHAHHHAEALQVVRQTLDVLLGQAEVAARRRLEQLSLLVAAQVTGRRHPVALHTKQLNVVQRWHQHAVRRQHLKGGRPDRPAQIGRP